MTGPSTWAPAWGCKKALLDGEELLAHATYQGIVPVRPTGLFAQKTFTMLQVLVPT